MNCILVAHLFPYTSYGGSLQSSRDSQTGQDVSHAGWFPTSRTTSSRKTDISQACEQWGGWLFYDNAILTPSQIQNSLQLFWASSVPFLETPTYQFSCTVKLLEQFQRCLHSSCHQEHQAHSQVTCFLGKKQLIQSVLLDLWSIFTFLEYLHFSDIIP